MIAFELGWPIIWARIVLLGYNKKGTSKFVARSKKIGPIGLIAIWAEWELPRHLPHHSPCQLPHHMLSYTWRFSVKFVMMNLYRHSSIGIEHLGFVVSVALRLNFWKESTGPRRQDLLVRGGCGLWTMGQLRQPTQIWCLKGTE